MKEFELNILGMSYKVIYSDLRKTNGNNDYGNITYAAGVIHIDTECTEEFATSTLLHEILHAIVVLLKLDIKHDDISRLEVGIYQVLKNNPKLLDLIKKA